MNLQLIRPELLNTNPEQFNVPREVTEFNYTGIAIEDRGSYYYWAKGASIEITEHEYQQIRSNSKIYYFSTALKLHLRIQERLHYFHNKGNYEEISAYETLEKVRIMINTFIEKRRQVSDGKIYHFSFGYLPNEFTGRISQDVYELLKDSVIFDVKDNWIINKKTGEQIRPIQKD